MRVCEQHWNPCGPSEVMLAGTPGEGFWLPPKPKEVTEGATPWIWAPPSPVARTTINRSEVTGLIGIPSAASLKMILLFVGQGNCHSAGGKWVCKARQSPYYPRKCRPSWRTFLLSQEMPGFTIGLHGPGFRVLGRVEAERHPPIECREESLPHLGCAGNSSPP